jgi:regulator of PEP synthase PpsR (kinase-PPPase family)
MFQEHTSHWQEIPDINQAIFNICQKENVKYIDLFTHFVDDNGQMNIFESKFEIKSHHHLNRYFKLLSNYLDHPKIKYVTESHHIYPKKYFPEYDSADYLVNLPKRVHFIAHHMLALAIGSTM